MNKEHKTKERKHKNKNIKSTYKTTKQTKISVDLPGKYKKDTNSQGYQYQDNTNLGQYHLVSEIQDNITQLYQMPKLEMEPKYLTKTDVSLNPNNSRMKSNKKIL